VERGEDERVTPSFDDLIEMESTYAMPGIMPGIHVLRVQSDAILRTAMARP
jgi:hypothetical protein